MRVIRDCKVVAGESVAKQHRIVVCKITMKMRKSKSVKTEHKTKWWKSRGSCEDLRREVRAVLYRVEEFLDVWETTATVIRERKVLGMSPGQRKEDKDTWWWDNEVQESVQRKILAKKRWDSE